VFILNGLDAYTSKNVASASGTGAPSSAAAPELLLEEAVLSYMDEFNGRLMSHFEDMFANGREIKIMIKVWDDAGIDLEEEFDVDGETDELGIHIEDWMSDNCVQGRFSLSDGTENFQKYEQVRIPMMYERKGKMRAMDAKRFAGNLRKYLAGEPFMQEAKVYMRGLGEAHVIIGGK